MIRFFILLLFMLPPQAAQASSLEYRDFAALPVQHEGRIKPMDTFARTMLEAFSGHQSLNGMSAQEWMAETLFGPPETMDRPLFRVFKPELLGLPQKTDPYYSAAEIAGLLNKKISVVGELEKIEEKNWSTDQRELMRLSEAFFLYLQLRNSFVYIHPLLIPQQLAESWGIKEGQDTTFRDYQSGYAGLLEKSVKDITRKNGYDPLQFSEEQNEMVNFFMAMKQLGKSGAGNSLLRIIPGMGDEWFSPWTLTEQGQGSPASAKYLKDWEDMARAYRSGDAQGWKKATEKAHAARPSSKINLEIAYNNIKPLLLAGMAYLFAFSGIVFYSLRNRSFARVAAFAALTAGALLHAGAIAARVIILDRAPVGTLYESIVFVALVCVIVALVLEKIRKDGHGILIGTMTGLILLFVAGSFTDGDTMKMLVAVLNTNFWLSTHVLCITMGYGWCLIASLLAHIWLVRTAIGKTGANLVISAKIVALIALLFTAVGTILGGIWADQSWGRFWGWDPKENGALLIVLWLIWVIHGQLGGQLSRAAFMAGIAALSVIVALAWFGVNLLSVGLHSYGFITGVAAALGAFCTVEALLIGFLWHRAQKKRIAA